MLSTLSIVILLIVIPNSIYFTSARPADPVMYGNSVTPSKYNVNMTIVDELNEGGGAKDIEIVEGIAYVLSDSGLNVYNVADPSNVYELGHYYTDGYLGHSIAVYKDYVFAAADDKGLKIINVTEPANPRLATTYTNTRPAGIFIQNELLFLANWINDFEIYDITNVPLISEVIRFKGNGFNRAFASDDLSIGFANNGSLLILDINNPENIKEARQINDEEISCVAIYRDCWYTGGSNGIKVFNSTQLSNPVLVKHFTETESSFITNLAVLNGFLYASDFELGFRIFEISESYNLSEIGRHEVGGVPLGFQVEGEIAYVASQRRGIEIVKIQITETRATYYGSEVILLSMFILGLFAGRRMARKEHYPR
ncbi:MAG: LVIVD repeat-containing protein [Candidatus Heimdallarchaeota archaeon]